MGWVVVYLGADLWSVRRTCCFVLWGLWYECQILEFVLIFDMYHPKWWGFDVGFHYLGMGRPRWWGIFV